VVANGLPAPSYQWDFNGTNLADQTNAQLIIAITQTNQAGTYSVTVSNLAGSTNVSFVLTVTPKPNLTITEVMSSENKGTEDSTLSTQDWWELSNLGNFPVNLQGFRFDDNHDLFTDAQTITNAVIIASGESIVLVEDMTSDDFRAWWGAQNLPANLQIVTYPSIGFSSDGDSIYLWNAAATSTADLVTSITFPLATRGVSFSFDPASKNFGGLSVLGQNGAFIAATNGDIGSPGTITSLPRVTQLGLNSNGEFNLSFVTQPAIHYSIEYKNYLTDPAWLTLTNFTAISDSFEFTDQTANTNTSRFYKIIITP
jgi:hypothetical protein